MLRSESSNDHCEAYTERMQAVMRKREWIERRQERLNVEADVFKCTEGEMMDGERGEQSITPPASETSACIQGSYAEHGRPAGGPIGIVDCAHNPKEGARGNLAGVGCVRMSEEEG